MEPEAAEPYALALRMDGALAVLTVGGHLATGEVLPSEDRERDFGDMVEAAFG